MIGAAPPAWGDRLRRRKAGRGGRVLDIETARHVPLERVATSMALEERLGSYELAPAVASRDAREAERRAAAGIAERVERLRAQPELIIDRLAEMRGGGRGVAGDRHGCVHHRTGGERRASGVRGGGDCRHGEVAAAARRRRGIGEAGFLVIGTPAAGDAARTLGEEAAIDTRTVRAAARGSQDRSRSVRPLIFRRERE